jgi:DNA polymerase-3 subunit epsilon
MTGGQVSINMNDSSDADSGEINSASTIRRLPATRAPLRVIAASAQELAEHGKKLDAIKAKSGECIWLNTGE